MRGCGCEPPDARSRYCFIETDIVDLVFGLFWLLGYQFSPRLADFGEARFWRMNPKADYGPLNGLARQRINIAQIARNWDDLLRAAGSLKMGNVSASELIRGLQGGGRPSTLGRAIGDDHAAPPRHEGADPLQRRVKSVRLSEDRGSPSTTLGLWSGEAGWPPPPSWPLEALSF
jgi:Tn3 transposase DDE domain